MRAGPVPADGASRAPPRSAALFAVVAVAVALGVTLASASFGPAPVGTETPVNPKFTLVNESSALGSVYHPGIILGAAANGSSALLGGIGVYTKVPEFTLPDLAAMTAGSNGVTVTNLTPRVNTYFFAGGVYAMGWNGTSWLIGGQAAWGGGTYNWGSLVALTGTTLVNRTSLLGSVFNGGGVFAMGWNGSAWLLGGNSTAGPVLESIQGTTVTNLTALLPPVDPNGWVQLIAWNGDEWLIGGEGVFGVLHGASYVDLWNSAPFQGSGVYAGGWNGSAWLAGGGAARLVLVVHDSVHPTPPLAGTFDQSVTFVQPIASGWLVGGTGTSPTGGFAPELVYWDGEGSHATSEDLTPSLPSAFLGGDLQSGCAAPLFGLNATLVVGEGLYDNATGYGVGAVALVTYSVGP